ncbi:MarR family winged helix-turn-helix transcriptional regulator [Kitasatospora sp. NPDC057223]|uniref:MarR family winged helix-turn-helix transcriptional regulator n=1 Tax=Kitasatospora sp. NPDC057223 TaxID=3346055 RepID=UPI003625B58D
MSRVHQLVLSTLARLGPHARLDLAVQVGASEADAERVVDDLLAAGLVHSLVVHAGGRQQLVMLTPAGQAALDALQGDATATQDVLLASLTRGERIQLKYLLRRVCASGAAHGGRARAVGP